VEKRVCGKRKGKLQKHTKKKTLKRKEKKYTLNGGHTRLKSTKKITMGGGHKTKGGGKTHSSDEEGKKEAKTVLACTSMRKRWHFAIWWWRLQSNTIDICNASGSQNIKGMSSRRHGRRNIGGDGSVVDRGGTKFHKTSKGRKTGIRKTQGCQCLAATGKGSFVFCHRGKLGFAKCRGGVERKGEASTGLSMR